MRRADLVWYKNATANTLTDVTSSLQNGTTPLTLNQNDILYVAHSDWLSGLVILISQVPPTQPLIDPQVYAGEYEVWMDVPVQERVDQLSIGHQIAPTGFTYQQPGLVTWNVSPYLWVKKDASDATFPEQGLVCPTTPILNYEGFWIRLVNNGPTPVTFDRILPQLFNTYTTYQNVARFLGVAEFTDEDDPTATYVRTQIRVAEDWIDDYTRRSWRPRLAINERYPINIFGSRLQHAPVLIVCRSVLWSFDQVVALIEGRSQDFYVSQDGNMLYFNAIGLGVMPVVGRIGSAYYRQQESMEIDYIYGYDFDIDRRSFMVKDTVERKVAADICAMADWAPALIANPEMSKPEKIRYYSERAEQQARELRAPYMI